MLLLALAIAPGLAICLFVFYKDNHNPEPPINLVMSFVWGMLAIVPAALIEWKLSPHIEKDFAGILLLCFAVVALSEEASKFLVLRWYAFPLKSFDEPLDGIIYSVIIAMGFATVENIFYITEHGLTVTQNGLSVAFLRMFTSVPGHATFGVIMGYYAGKARYDVPNRKRLLVTGLLYAILAHGCYDSFLLLSQYNWLTQYVSELLLAAGAFISLYICIRLSRKLLALHRETSYKLFTHKPVLTIRNAGKEDVPLIRNLALQIWPVTYSGILSPKQVSYMLDLMYSEQALLRQMDDHQFIILYNAGIAIGFASYSETEPSVYKLHKIYLLPNQQGRGSGRFVIEQIVNELISKGATALRLNVNRNNKAQWFYQRLDFTVVSEENIDIGGGFFMNDYVMEKKLGNEHSASGM